MPNVLPVVDGGSSQHHGIIVGPFGRVAPALLVAVPEVAAGRIADEPLGETLPHGEGEVNLDIEGLSLRNCVILKMFMLWCGTGFLKLWCVSHQWYACNVLESQLKSLEILKSL